MEPAAEKECSALGGLFQLIINDLKGGTPAWEDFLGKAAKLHSQLKATVAASAAFLDAFQKIADMATSTRGATKDIGTALTRLCLRHRSVEARLKTYTGSLMDSLVVPLQDRLEEWKKVAYQLDKDHAKEYKRVRQEIKKKSSDTLRLQKKVRKAGKGDMQRTLDNALQDVTDRYLLLEETEKQAVRKALIEERSHYCIFVACLKPVVESELAVLQEVTHLQEVVDALTKLTEDPHSLPSASEQVISDIKGSDSGWSFHTPPSSPTSLGSRKSSVCSISSLNSSSSGSTKSHSPSHHSRCRSLSQPPAGALRLSSVSSQDSGFTSQDTLCMRLPTPPPMELISQVPNLSEYTNSAAGVVSTTGTPASPYPPAPCVTATWPNLQDTLQFERAAASILKNQRPHTISTAYERAGHNRPALTAQTFQPLSHDLQQEANGICESLDTLTTEDSSFDHSSEEKQDDGDDDDDDMTAPNKELPPTPTHPPLPDRYTEPDKPDVPAKPHFMKSRYLRSASKLESLVADLSRAVIGPDDQPVYANLAELLPSLSGAEAFPDPPLPADSEAYNKSAFQKDLAAILAQSLLLQQQLQQNESHSDDSSDLPPPPLPVSSDFLEDQKCKPGMPPQSSSMHDYHEDNMMTPTTQKRPMSFAGNLTSPENKISTGVASSRSGAPKPPPPIRRSSSLSASSPVQHENSMKRNRPEPRPPVKSPPLSQADSSFRSRSTGIRGSEDMAKSPPLCESFMPIRMSRKDGERSASSGGPSVSCASASVPCETTETRNTAHSQLIQALNARLSVLQHSEVPEQQRRNLVTETQNTRGKEQVPATASQNIQEVTGKPPIHSMFGMAHTLAHPPKKSHRAHSLTGNDRESFIQSLNSRFAQSQQAGFRTVQRKPSLQEAPLRVKHAAGHKPLAHHIAHRRASQPSLDQMHEVALGFGSHSEGFNVTPGDRSSKQNFLLSLNAKLSQQQQSSSQSDRNSTQIDLKQNVSHSRQSTGTLPLCSRSTLDNGHPSTNEAAARVQSWLASRGSMDDAACRESLLCQIRQGIPLRKVPSNDRSAPRF